MQDTSWQVTGTQKFCTYWGYYLNTAARYAGRNFEQMIRTQTSPSELIKLCVPTLVSLPIAALNFLPSLFFSAVASVLGRGHFELLEDLNSFWDQRSLKIMSLNACLQDPWAPLTGGVETPMARIVQLANAVAFENPDVFMGQEFDDINAQDAFIRSMSEKGYGHFLRDLGSNSPICNHSGLFVASKAPIEAIDFVPYPLEDRNGLARWSNQGALAFSIRVNDQIVRIINVHLNYGEGKANQQARNRQLRYHVAPLMKEKNTVLVGDLNFDTATVDPNFTGLKGFVNAIEGQVTCTDEGKHQLRGKPRSPTCEECAEKIDGLIYHPDRTGVESPIVKQLKCGDKLLSDHFAIITTVNP